MRTVPSLQTCCIKHICTTYGDTRIAESSLKEQLPLNLFKLLVQSQEEMLQKCSITLHDAGYSTTWQGSVSLSTTIAKVKQYASLPSHFWVGLVRTRSEPSPDGNPQMMIALQDTQTLQECGVRPNKHIYLRI